LDEKLKQKVYGQDRALDAVVAPIKLSRAGLTLPDQPVGAFLFAGELGARLHNPEVDIYSTQAYSSEDTAYREFCVKLQKIKDRMLTAAGRRIALERHEFMVAYFDRLTNEVQGRE